MNQHANISTEDRQQWQQDLAQRYSAIAIPDPSFSELWWELQQRGCCDPRHPAHLQLSDLIWLTGAEICQMSLPSDQVPGLIPFAHTTGDDLWCWYFPWTWEGRVPVVFCPHEDEVAYAYAPDMAGFLFRAVLEEYACTCLTEYHSPGKSQAVLGNYAELVAPLLPSAWGSCLQAVAQRPLQELENAYYGTLTATEAAAIIHQHFADWPHLEQEFEHYQ